MLYLARLSLDNGDSPDTGYRSRYSQSRVFAITKVFLCTYFVTFRMCSNGVNFKVAFNVSFVVLILLN